MTSKLFKLYRTIFCFYIAAAVLAVVIFFFSTFTYSVATAPNSNYAYVKPYIPITIHLIDSTVESLYNYFIDSYGPVHYYAVK